MCWNQVSFHVDSHAKRLFSSSLFARKPSGIGLEVKVVKAENMRL